MSSFSATAVRRSIVAPVLFLSLAGLLPLAGCASGNLGASPPEFEAWPSNAQFDLGPNGVLRLALTDIREQGIPLGPYQRPSDEAALLQRAFGLAGEFAVLSRSESWNPRHGSRATFTGTWRGADWQGPIAVMVFQDGPDRSQAVLIRLLEPADGRRSFSGLSTASLEDSVEVRFGG